MYYNDKVLRSWTHLYNADAKLPQHTHVLVNPTKKDDDKMKLKTDVQKNLKKETKIKDISIREKCVMWQTGGKKGSESAVLVEPKVKIM